MSAIVQQIRGTVWWTKSGRFEVVGICKWNATQMVIKVRLGGWMVVNKITRWVWTIKTIKRRSRNCSSEPKYKKTICCHLDGSKNMLRTLKRSSCTADWIESTSDLWVTGARHDSGDVAVRSEGWMMIGWVDKSHWQLKNEMNKKKVCLSRFTLRTRTLANCAVVWPEDVWLNWVWGYLFAMMRSTRLGEQTKGLII